MDGRGRALSGTGAGMVLALMQSLSRQTQEQFSVLTRMNRWVTTCAVCVPLQTHRMEARYRLAFFPHAFEAARKLQGRTRRLDAGKAVKCFHIRQM